MTYYFELPTYFSKMTRLVRGTAHDVVETYFQVPIEIQNKRPWTILLDVSGSMSFFLPKVKAALQVFSTLCHPEATVSVWAFNDTVVSIVENQRVKTMDWNIVPEPQGSTNFEQVLDLLKSLHCMQDVLLLSDGMPTAGSITSTNKQSFPNLFQVFDAVAKECIAKNIQVHTLAQRTSGSMPIEFLSQMSNSTGGIHHTLEGQSNNLEIVLQDVLAQQDAYFGIVKSIESNTKNLCCEVPLNAVLGLHKTLRKGEKVSWLVEKVTEPKIQLSFANGSSMTLSVTETIDDIEEVHMHELRVKGLELLSRCQHTTSWNHPLNDFFADQVAEIQAHPSYTDPDGILRRIEKLIAVQVPHPDADFAGHISFEHSQVLHHGLSAQRDSVGIRSPWRTNTSLMENIRTHTLEHTAASDPSQDEPTTPVQTPLHSFVSLTPNPRSLKRE